MKQVFQPIRLLLWTFAIWIAGVFLSLFRFDALHGIQVRSYGIWGDWSAHLTFIESFRERGISWILEPSPLFQEAPFRYPFLSHGFTAGISALLGVDSIHGMILISTVLVFALPLLLFRFYRTHDLSPRASLFSTFGFLLMGGLQFLDRGLDSAKPLTNQFEHGSIFTQFLIFEFFPQRAFLFGICIVLWVFGSLRKPTRKGTQIFLGAGLALLPLIHLHSFLAASVFLVSLLVFPHEKGAPFSKRIPILRFGLLVAVPALACVGFLFHTKNPHALSWNFLLPGWAQNPAAGQPAAAAMNPLWFWMYNTGLFLPACLAGVWWFRGRRGLRALALSGGTLFAVSLLFCIQPYFYDNLKLFTYAFLFLSPFFGLILERIGSRIRILAPILLALQCASAARDLWSFQGGIEQTTWFGPSELRLAEEFRKIRESPNDRVLIHPIHNHPIPCLTGNPVVMGYPGWLWSWGIDFADLERRVGSVLSGDSEAIQNVARLAPRYIVVHPRESHPNRPVSFPFLDSHFKKILTVDDWRVYRVDLPSR